MRLHVFLINDLKEDLTGMYEGWEVDETDSL
jgi:hypothetical protein